MTTAPATAPHRLDVTITRVRTEHGALHLRVAAEPCGCRPRAPMAGVRIVELASGWSALRGPVTGYREELTAGHATAEAAANAAEVVLRAAGAWCEGTPAPRTAADAFDRERATVTARAKLDHQLARVCPALHRSFGGSIESWGPSTATRATHARGVCPDAAPKVGSLPLPLPPATSVAPDSAPPPPPTPSM